MDVASYFISRIILRFSKPMVIELGQRFTFRSQNVTLGTGVVTKIRDNLPELERLAVSDGKKGIMRYDQKVAEKARRDAEKLKQKTA